MVALMDDYLIRFAVRHNPNNGTGPEWPEYTKESNWTYVFPPSWQLAKPKVELDTRRVEQMAFLTNLSLIYPL